MQCACAMLSCGLPAVQYFPHYGTNGTIFGKKALNLKCVFWFSIHLLSQTFLILRYHKYTSCWYQISRKSVQWESSCSIRTDGWMDMTEITVAFPNFANASKTAAIAPQSASHSRSVLLCSSGNDVNLYICPSSATYSQREPAKDPS